MQLSVEKLTCKYFCLQRVFSFFKFWEYNRFLLKKNLSLQNIPEPNTIIWLQPAGFYFLCLNVKLNSQTFENYLTGCYSQIFYTILSGCLNAIFYLYGLK